MAHGITTLVVQDTQIVRDGHGGSGDTTLQIHGLDVVASIIIVVSQDMHIAICVSCLHIDLICKEVIVSYQRISHVAETASLKVSAWYTSKLIICQDGLSFYDCLKTVELLVMVVQL